MEFRYGTETDLLKLVGTNELQYMIGSGEEVILGRSQGLPVRYVLRWYRKFPAVLFAKASSGIKEPADLAGKKVGVPGLYGANYVGWEALVYATGLDQKQVSLHKECRSARPWSMPFLGSSRVACRSFNRRKPPHLRGSFQWRDSFNVWALPCALDQDRKITALSQPLDNHSASSGCPIPRLYPLYSHPPCAGPCGARHPGAPACRPGPRLVCLRKHLRSCLDSCSIWRML